MLVSRALPLVSLLVVGASASSSAQMAVTPSRTNATVPVSSSVVAMYIAARVEPGMERLELLVLWRGEPGWFSRAGVSSGGAGGLIDGYRVHSRFGETEIEAVLDQRTETATVLGQRLDLRHANVVLIDGVGTQPAVVGTLGLQAQVLVTPGTMLLDRLPAIVFAQQEIRAFLRCETAAPGRPVVAGICGRR